MKNQLWGCAKRRLAPNTPESIREAVLWYYYTNPYPSAKYEEALNYFRLHRHYPKQELLQTRLETAMPSRTAPEEVITFFAESPPVSVRGHVRYADALFFKGRKKEAISSIMAIWENTEMSLDDERYILHKYGTFLSEEDVVGRFNYDLITSHLLSAYRLIGNLKSKERKIARLQYALERHHISPRSFLHRFPDDVPLHPGALYQLAQTYLERGNFNAAYAVLTYKQREDVPIDKSVQRAINTLQLHLARRFIHKHDYNRAYGVLVSFSGADADLQARLSFLAGWLSLRANRDIDAAKKYFQISFQKGKTLEEKAQASYWLGRTYEQAGHSDRASLWFTYAARYPTTYYGQVSLSNLSPTDRVVLPLPPLPTYEDRKMFTGKEMIRLTDGLATRGYTDLAVPFVFHVAKMSNAPKEFYMLADLAHLLKRPDWAISIARQALKKNVILIKYAYPRINKGLPLSAGIPTWLINAVVRQESSFNFHAVSPVKARGLMQLMPRTAKFLSTSLGMAVGRRSRHAIERALVRSPSLNLRLGSTYLARLQENFDNYTLTIAAYDAGPGRVKKWLKNFSLSLNTPAAYVDFIEMIPFPETRNYVKNVLRDASVYFALERKGGRKTS